MRHLYPSIKPYQRHMLNVNDQHTLYLDESGNKDGIPILFLHGGPGRACDRHSRRYCDPNIYRIITWDQRGCGRSLPHGCLDNNTTADLISDIEQIRIHLKIGRWMLLGEGWGGTLSLNYALKYPDKVLALITSGLFLGTEQDVSWLYKNGLNCIFPDYWAQFIENIPEAYQAEPLPFYYDILMNQTNDLIKMAHAKAWGLWMTRCSTLRLNQTAIDDYQEAHRALATAKIAIHFAMHQFFMESNKIIDNMDSICHIPAILIHGRYDMQSTVNNSYSLAQKWSVAECQIVRDAGHSIIEPTIQDALVRATDTFANRFRSEFNLNSSS